MKNIFFLTPTCSLHRYNGELYHILELSEAFNKLGFNVTLAIGNNPDKQIDQLPFTNRLIPLSNEGNTTLQKLKRELISYWKLFGAIIQNQVDVVYIRQYLFSFIPAFIARIFRIPILTEVNGIYFLDRQTMKATNQENPKESKFEQLLDKFLIYLYGFGFQLSDKIIVVSSSMIDHINKEYKIPLKKLKLCRNGVNIDTVIPLERRCCCEKLGIDPNNRFFGYFGSLSKWQGCENLIKAFTNIHNKIPSHKLLFVGDGFEKEYLRSLAESNNILDKVIFVGAVPYQQVTTYTGVADFTIAPLSPGTRNEIMAPSILKIPHSLAAGRPIIISKFSGLEFIEEERVGYLVEPGDIEMLGETLLKAANLSEDNHENMRKRARILCENQFSWTTTAKCILHAFQEQK